MTKQCGSIVADQDIRCENKGTVGDEVVAAEFSINTPYGLRKMMVIYCKDHFEQKKKEIMEDDAILRVIG